LDFRQNILDEIEETAKGVMSAETTMVVGFLKIVPRDLGVPDRLWSVGDIADLIEVLEALELGSLLVG